MALIITNSIPMRSTDGTLWFEKSPRGLDDVFDVAMIRKRPAWIELPDPGFNRCIDIGGGNKMISGWIGLDHPAWDAERDEIPFPEESVDAIFTAHTLDHLSAEAVHALLIDAQRVLRSGCAITIVVPHFMSTLAWECIEHKTRYGIKTWRNMLNNPAYSPLLDNKEDEWKLDVGYNMIMGVEERNLVLVSQLVKR